MNRIILMLCVTLAAAKEDVRILSSSPIFPRTLEHNIDKFIDVNGQQQQVLLNSYARTLDVFTENYSARLETILLQLDMLIEYMGQHEQSLNSLEAISLLCSCCVNTYRSSIPSVNEVKANTTGCVVKANSQITFLLSGANSVKISLEYYYKNIYEKAIEECRRNYGTQSQNCSLCVINATKNANVYIAENKKNFNHQMITAECKAKEQISIALRCSFDVQSNTFSRMAETNAFIDGCLDLNKKSKSCDAEKKDV